jgi:hypothetical protein
MAGHVGSLDIEISGVVPTAEMLEAIGQRAIHLDPALEEIMDLLLEGERTLWKRSGRKWMRTLSPSTQARHRREGTSALVGSGALEDSLTKHDGRGAIRKAHGDQLVFGSSVYYARFQDKNKRQILVFRPADKKQARVILVDHLMGRLGSV